MPLLPKRLVSKLSILFILSILLPGLLLSYFSIQNINSQKELTEKRIIEEQNELAAQLSAEFIQKIQNCALTFFSNVEENNWNFEPSDSIWDSSGCIIRYFLLNFQGQFIRPHFVEQEEFKTSSGFSPEFLKTIQQAELAEFSGNTLQNANDLYFRARQIATTPLEKAKALNGTARVYFKRGWITRAYQDYLQLAHLCGHLIDDSGFPYGYYALHQMIKALPTIPVEQISRDISAILSMMINGEIPLTSQTNLLLEELESWCYQNQKDFSLNMLQNQIQTLKSWLAFHEAKGGIIKEYFTRRDVFGGIKTIDQYETIVSERDNQPLLFLLRRQEDQQFFACLEVALENIKSEILCKLNPVSADFDFNINIISRNQLNQNFDSLSSIHELHPTIPLWRIVIRLTNPEMVNRLITRQCWIYGISITLLIAGMLLGITLLLRDISREQRLARLRSDFVSNVSHELKTPLTSIRMFAETMKLGRILKKNDQLEYLSVIVNETERLTRLINTVLDFSQIEQGKKQYEKSVVNISRLVKSAVRAMEYSLKEQGFKLNQRIDENMKTKVDGDAIEQAVLNLLSNAMKYSKQKKEITIQLWSNHGSIYIRVIDKGVGIPESEQKQIFEKYYRVQVEGKKGAAGAGLGLTVVKHIVKAHGGSIELESKVGEGSSFTIIIPEEDNR
jgi:signal transduction histidine kinase